MGQVPVDRKTVEQAYFSHAQSMFCNLTYMFLHFVASLLICFFRFKQVLRNFASRKKENKIAQDKSNRILKRFHDFMILHKRGNRGRLQPPIIINKYKCTLVIRKQILRRFLPAGKKRNIRRFLFSCQENAGCSDTSTQNIK